MEEFYVGVDMGTGSCRAGLVTSAGRLVGQAVREVKVANPRPDHYIQSSTEVWEAVCSTVRQVVEEAGISKDQVKGMGFDATCSLVLVGEGDSVVAVEEGGREDIVMWMDHRAKEQAEAINATKHQLLDYVGGGVSLEMQLPKLLWLKTHRPQLWKSARAFYDLPDWLVYKATGVSCRSLCSLVCKWNYRAGGEEGQQPGWDWQFLKQVGLEDLGPSHLGSEVLHPGAAVPGGLSPSAASALGLAEGTCVGAGLIDAHAGALGLLATPGPEVAGRLALVCGTSTCHMLLANSPGLVPGVWGPFYSAVYPGLWLLEGGQSSTGGLLDHVIHSHPALPQLEKFARERSCSLYAALEALLCDMVKEQGKELQGQKDQEKKQEFGRVTRLTRDLHVWPDYHGNRSPLANPGMRGGVVGLGLDSGVTSLALQYLATLQALCYGTRHILEQLELHGHPVTSVSVCGGLSSSPLFLQTQADVLGREVTVPRERQSMLLGSSMLGMAAAEGGIEKVVARLQGEQGPGEVHSPGVEEAAYHEAKYRVYRHMGDHQISYRTLMESA